MHISFHETCCDRNIVDPVTSMTKMPVHLAYDRRTLIEKELDHFVDSKGCLQSSSRALHHRLEPVCCCERCYACLANPLLETLSSDQDWIGQDQEFAGHDGANVLLTGPEWFSLYPHSPCGCECCLDEFGKLRGKDKGQTDPTGNAHDSPLNKKRMTSNSSSEGKALCPRFNRGRRPLVDLQWGDFVDEEDDAVKRPPDLYDARSSWSRDGHQSSRDETCSWVQPPPNRTICHIVDDVTLERLASSSPRPTRCCLASRRHGSGRHAGKTKAKNQPMSR